MYPPVNKHSKGKSPSWIGNTSSNGGFSIAMLNYRSVPYKKQMMVIFVRGFSYQKNTHVTQISKSKRQDVLSKLCTCLSQESRSMQQNTYVLPLVLTWFCSWLSLQILPSTGLTYPTLRKENHRPKSGWVVRDTWSFPGEYSFISW